MISPMYGVKRGTVNQGGDSIGYSKKKQNWPHLLLKRIIKEDYLTSHRECTVTCEKYYLLKRSFYTNKHWVAYLNKKHFFK